MNKKDLKLLKEKIQQAKTIAISGHKNLDGDALCSALALMRIIELNYNKSVDVIYDGNVPLELENVPLRSRATYYKHIPTDKKYDLYILVDYGTKTHLGGVMPFVDNALFVAEFDHHYNDEKIGAVCFDNESKAATAQLIYDFVRTEKLKTDKEIIDLITLGIITDTGQFKFVSSDDVFTDSAQLVKSGANITDLVNLLQNKNKKTVLTESLAVSNAEFFYHGRLVVATIDRASYKKLDGRGELALNTLATIHGVEYIVLLKEQKENVIGVSIRSKTKPINHIAQTLGGGGHLYAAGAVVSSDLESVRNKVIMAFRGV